MVGAFDINSADGIVCECMVVSRIQEKIRDAQLKCKEKVN